MAHDRDKKSTAQKKKRFLSAYHKNLCNISKTCAVVRINRCTFYRWCDADSKFSQAVKDCEERLYDEIESTLLKKCKKGDITSLIWFMKCKMKHRGYEERVHDSHGNINIHINRIISDKPIPIEVEVEKDKPKEIAYEKH